MNDSCSVKVPVTRPVPPEEKIAHGGSEEKRNQDEDRHGGEQTDKKSCNRSAAISLSLSDWSQRWGLGDEVSSVFLKVSLAQLLVLFDT